MPRTPASQRNFLTAAALLGSVSVLPTATQAASIGTLPFSTDLSSQFFVITTNGSGNDATDGVTSVDIQNFEIGANRAPVPSTDDFLSGGSSGGPTLLGAVPDIPLNLPGPNGGVVNPIQLEQGVGGNANIAITNPNDSIELSDVGVHADPDVGIQLAAPDDSFNTSQNSFFNSGGRFPAATDPLQFPNTFEPSGPTGVLNNQGGTGQDTNPNDADQNTRIDPSGNGNPSANTGITFGVQNLDLLAELDAQRTAINALETTAILDLSGGNAGQFDAASVLSDVASIPGVATLSSTVTQAGAFNPSGDSRDFLITLAEGLNVIDINPGSNDILLNNSNLVIDGPEDSTAIFRFTDENFLVSNSNILLGDSGIGLNNILFFTDQSSNDTIFGFNNTILNGIAFHSLGDDGGTISVQNGQGSTQFIADTVILSDVRFTLWPFDPTPTPIPSPTAVGIGLTGLAGLAMCRRRDPSSADV